MPLFPAALNCASIVLLGMIATARADELERSPWALQVSGYTHHFQGTHRRAHPDWNSNNAGLGIQYDMPGQAASPWTTVLSAGFMRDSYGTEGLYAGAARLYRINDSRIQARIGGGAFAAYRALDWDDSRKLTLLIMPILSFEDTRSGLGLNITASPSIRYNSRKLASFIFFQGTYRF
jgi:hypothetical protein